ncbi:hypothetical protein ACP70R_031619 [Stipagrostis hirtigluma subsp. patula]
MIFSFTAEWTCIFQCLNRVEHKPTAQGSGPVAM